MSNDDLHYRRRDLPWQTLDGIGLLLQPEAHLAHELNRVGAFVWQQLDEPRSIQQLCEQVAEEFDTGGVGIETDIAAFIEELVAKELVECLDRP